MVLIEDRKGGIYNRTLAAGCKPYQFLVSHLFLGSAIMMLQAIEFIGYAIYVGHDSASLRFIFLVSTLLILIGFSAILYGLCISVVTDSTLVATQCGVMATFPFFALSGELSKLAIIA